MLPLQRTQVQSPVWELRSSHMPYIFKKVFKQGDFPSGPVVKNLLTSAAGTCSIPGLGTKTPHAARHLRPCATGTEPAPCSPGSATREATAMRRLHTATKRSPGWAQRENTHVQQQSPDAPKIIIRIIRRYNHWGT